MTLTNILKIHGALLFVGVLAGCGPKEIGAESDTNINEPEPMCTDGEMKPAPDGCNTCTCIDGEWGCTEKACADEDAPAAECQPGETKMEGCNSCECFEGIWACTDAGCVATTTDDPGETATETIGETDFGESETEATSGGTTGVVAGCGDGLVQAELGEQCDDGNEVDGDGCSSECLFDGAIECAMPQDPLTIVDAKIEGDGLVLDVEYSGGCEEHDVGYCWDGFFAESLPVQVWLDIWHDGKDDACDAIVQQQRILDLTQLKTAWQDGYQQEHGDIVVHVDGWDENLLYAF